MIIMIIMIIIVTYYILYFIDIELRESANGNNHFSSILWFTLTAYFYAMGRSSLAFKATDTRNSTF